MNNRIDSWPVGLALFVWFWVVIFGSAWLIPDSLNKGWPVLVIFLAALFGGWTAIMLGSRVIAPEWSRRLTAQEERDRKGRQLAEIDETEEALKEARRGLRQ